MNPNHHYVVATIKDWHIEAFKHYSKALPGNWHLVTNKAQLTPQFLRQISPKYIFFPHWSWIVPKEILTQFNCVCFHMTDLPYGRGGSPLQNLIARGHQETKLTALKMTEELDAGPIYLKSPLSLTGSAQQIFERSALLTAKMITSIVELQPEPTPQTGAVTHFNRRTPEQSEIQGNESLDKLYDVIRMLDAKSYPKAFLHYGDFTLHFENAQLTDDSLSASVSISKREK